MVVSDSVCFNLRISAVLRNKVKRLSFNEFTAHNGTPTPKSNFKTLKLSNDFIIRYWLKKCDKETDSILSMVQDVFLEFQNAKNQQNLITTLILLLLLN